MGAYSSSHLTPEEIDELTQITHFTSKEIEQLYHRFKKLDRSRTGVISQKDFQLISELSLNPMSQRLLSLFQNESGESALVSDGGVTFNIFVRTLDYFNARTPSHEKLAALFRLYDCDGDGRVSERDLRAVLRHYVGTHVSEAALRVMSRNTMTHALASCGVTDADVKQKQKQANDSSKAKKLPHASPRNNVEDQPSTLPLREEGEGRSLTFEQFSQAIGEEALEAMNVAIPIRE